MNDDWTLLKTITTVLCVALVGAVLLGITLAFYENSQAHRKVLRECIHQDGKTPLECHYAVYGH